MARMQWLSAVVMVGALVAGNSPLFAQIGAGGGFAPGVGLVPGRGLSVNGVGTVKVAPDRVAISLEMTTADDDLVRLRTNSNRQLATILDAVQKQGGKPGEFKVSKMQLSLSFNDQLKRQIFHLERSGEVVLLKVENLNLLLVDLIKLPDLHVTGIRFDSSKEEAHLRAARKMAAADALSRATELAEIAQLKLGKARSISPFSETSRPFVTSVIPVVGMREKNGRQGGGGFFAVGERKGDGADEVEGTGPLFLPVVQPGDKPAAEAAAFGLGEVEYSATLTIEYDLLDK